LKSKNRRGGERWLVKAYPKIKRGNGRYERRRPKNTDQGGADPGIGAAGKKGKKKWREDGKAATMARWRVRGRLSERKKSAVRELTEENGWKGRPKGTGKEKKGQKQQEMKEKADDDGKTQQD